MEGIIEEKMENWVLSDQLEFSKVLEQSCKAVMDGKTPSPGLQDAAIPVPHFEWNFNYK